MSVKFHMQLIALGRRLLYYRDRERIRRKRNRWRNKFSELPDDEKVAIFTDLGEEMSKNGLPNNPK